MTRLSGAMAITKSLATHGIDTVFGLPGGQLDHLFDALYQHRDRIRLICSRHEQGAAYMAFGYARSTGRPSVYTVVPGPGVLNTAAALCTAYACNAPVLCLAGQIPTEAIGRGFGELHELPDQLGTLRRLTKWAARIESPAAAPRMIGRAFAALRSGRPRPVALEMAPDVMAREAEVPELLPESSPASVPDPALIRQAAEIIAAARTPLIYVGGGAIAAAAAIGELAGMLDAPVVSFRSGRGIVPDDHPLGFTLPAGHRLWPKVDVVIGVGSRMLEPLRHWGADPELKIVRVDIDPEEVARAGEPDVGLVCDAGAALAALIPEVARRLRRRASRRGEYAALKAAVAADIERVQPQMEYLKAIREVLPQDGFFCDEITQCGFASWYAFPVSRPREHINCGYQGTLGYGYATALGVKVAHPDRAVVSIAGDGGFFFNLPELATAVQYGIALKTIVFNSGSYANVKRQQREWFGNRLIASDLKNPDFVKLAEAFGAAAYRAQSPTELRAVLERSLGEPGPALIEVPVGEMASPWPFILLPRVRGSATEEHAG
jgi:acetolactate synthase I/II/III large subunit